MSAQPDFRPGEARVAQLGAYLDGLQRRLCERFESLEPQAQFVSTRWSKPADHRLKGGGHMRLLRGEVLEKAGVNVSHVWGQLSEAGQRQLPGAEASGGQFMAGGLSLVVHPANPHAPTGHMNLRYLETSHRWIGGGADLTPTFPYDEDTQQFHAALREACEPYRPGAYADFKAQCDRYFFLPHRNEPRGVGGVFFDDLDSGDWLRDFQLLERLGEAFLVTYGDILERRQAMPASAADRDRQLEKRGRYVEFNLVYDRGTKFGFMTDANPEAYLMSLPPMARW